MCSFSKSDPVQIKPAFTFFQYLASLCNKSPISQPPLEVWETGDQPILVGLSETHVRTEEELSEDVEKKLPNLPVAFIQVSA